MVGSGIGALGPYDSHKTNMNSHLSLALLMMVTIQMVNTAPVDSSDVEEYLEEEYNVDSEANSVYADRDKRLFENFESINSKEEKLRIIQELKEKNIEDQKRRKAERRRRRRRMRKNHDGKMRVNRNAKR